MAYSIDLRKKVVDFVLSGNKITDASRIFKLSRTTIKKWLNLYNNDGTLTPKYKTGMKNGRIIDNDELREYVRQNPDAYGREIAAHFGCSAMGVYHALNKLGIHIKKTKLYRERDEQARSKYSNKLSMLSKMLPWARKLYLDETGFAENMPRTHGWAPAGKRLEGKVSARKGKRLNLISAHTKHFGKQEFIAPKLLDRNVNKEVFIQWLRDDFAPNLRCWDIVIMDNAPWHKSEEVRRIITGRGAFLMFLPPYSPDLNPIENDWANLKRKVRECFNKFQNITETLKYIMPQVSSS